MRLAIILPKLANQGPVIVAKDIVENIKNKIEVIDVYYFDDVCEIDFDCNTYKINFFTKIDFNKYDVVHSHMLRPDLYVWFNRKSHNVNTLFISTLHQNIYDNLKGNYNIFIAFLFEKIWLKILKKQDIVVTLTNTMKDFYEKKTKLNFKTIYNGRNYLVNPNPNPKLNIEDLNILSNLKSKYKIIGTHCLLTKRKGIIQIIYSLVSLKDFALVVIGDGQELENLIRAANEFGVSNRCIFLGYRPNAVEYLNFFDIYIMASYSEGFPLGLLEAGLSRLPVVCSDIPIFRELFNPKEVCFFELNNDKALIESVRKCYNNKEEFASLIFKCVSSKYNITNMANNYMLLYQNK